MAGVKMSKYTISIVTNCFGKLKLIDQGISLIAHSIKCGITIDDHVITSVLNGFISERRSDEAVLFFDNILKFEKRTPSTLMYNILLKGLCQEEDYKSAIQLFDAMQREPDKISYTILIDYLFEKKNLNEGVFMLNRMLSDTRVILDSKLFGAAIKRLLDQNHLLDAKMLLVLMVQKNVSFEANFVNVLLGYYAKKGMMKHGEAVFQFMIKRGISPTLITFNTLLLGYSVSNQVPSAERIYHLMITGSVNVSPDIVSSTTLLKCYCNNVSLVEKATEFFKKTFRQEEGYFAPNVITFGTMIKGLLKAGKLDCAREFMSEMKSLKIHASQKFYGMVLDGLQSNGRVSLADSYFREPENDKFNKDVVVWNIMIKGAIANDLFDLAKAYKKEMQHRGIQPDGKTFGPMLIAFYGQNFTAEANELVDEMRKLGIPIQYAYNDLKMAYRKTRLAVEKKRLWAAMKKMEKEVSH